MSSFHRGPGHGSSIQFATPPLTPMVKQILIALGVAFVAQTLLQKTGFGELVAWLSLYPPLVVWKGALWQLVTYGLLHGGLWHLLMNCLGLWMLGGDVERVLGSRGFLKYFIICVAGGGVLHTVLGLLVQRPAPVVGASAGILGIVLAFALFFPERQLFLFPLPFPIRARTFALIFGAIDLFGAIDANPSDGIAHFAHLGGMAAGWIYLALFSRRGPRKPRGPRLTGLDGGRGGPFDIH